MLGVTAAAGTTAGFAWFTTVRTATVSLTSAHVYTDYGNLSIQYVALDSGLDTASQIVADHTGETNSLGLSATRNITDISGDGVDFYKPTWAPADTNGTNATHITQISNGEKLLNDGTTIADTSKTWYVQFGLKLINSGAAAFDVYLSNGSAVTANSTSIPADVQAVKATRVAIWTGDNTTCKTMWQYVPDTVNKYIKYTGTSSDYAYSVAKYNLDDAKGTDFASVWHESDWSTVTVASSVDGQDLGTVPAATTNAGVTTNGSITVNVSMWLEGTTVAAANAAIGGNVNLALDLAAV